MLTLLTAQIDSLYERPWPQNHVLRSWTRWRTEQDQYWDEEFGNSSD